MNGKIVFIGGPWAKGHQLETLNIQIGLLEAGIMGPAHTALSIDLKSEPYRNAEQTIETHEDLPNWESSDAWSVSEACNFSTAIWHKDLVLSYGFDLDSLSELDVFERLLDPIDQIDPDSDEFFDERVFPDSVVQGHDIIAGHHIHISKTVTGRYGVVWDGKVASAYSGDHEFAHNFRVEASDVPFGGYIGRFLQDTRSGMSLADREKTLRQLAGTLIKDSASLKFEEGEYYSEDRLIPV